MNLFATSNARQFRANLSRYATETGKSMSQALAREGPDFKMELYKQFRKIRPPRESILASAERRGFRVRRLRSTFLVRAAGGVSARALAKASELLGGQKSELFRPLHGGLVPVRFSARGKHRRLQGGRTGRRFAKSALRAYQISSDQLAASLAEDRKIGTGIRRLNQRALAIYLELLYRQRASGGGTMAVQWLHKTYKRTTGRVLNRGRLVQRSATGIPIGDVEFQVSENLLTGITFHGYVPGTAQQADKHDIINQAFAARGEQLLKAIKFHHDKVARQAGLK